MRKYILITLILMSFTACRSSKDTSFCRSTVTRVDSTTIRLVISCGSYVRPPWWYRLTH